MRQLLVVQYEQFFDLLEAADFSEGVTRGLEALQEYGGARVVGTYVAEDDKAFKAKELGYIEVPVKTRIRIGY